MHESIIDELINMKDSAQNISEPNLFLLRFADIHTCGIRHSLFYEKGFFENLFYKIPRLSISCFINMHQYYQDTLMERASAQYS